MFRSSQNIQEAIDNPGLELQRKCRAGGRVSGLTCLEVVGVAIRLDDTTPGVVRRKPQAEYKETQYSRSEQGSGANEKTREDCQHQRVGKRDQY